MPKKTLTGTQAPPKTAKAGNDYSVKDVEEMEKLALDRANKAISAIENAIAVWDASKDKPEDLKPRMVRLKYFYEALMGWEKKMLQTMGKEDKIGPRVERLKEFTEICYSYA